MSWVRLSTGPLTITWKDDDVGDGRIRHCLKVFCGTGIIGREYEMTFNGKAEIFDILIKT
jgi:hypothetical protein